MAYAPWRAHHHVSAGLKTSDTIFEGNLVLETESLRYMGRPVRDCSAECVVVQSVSDHMQQQSTGILD